MSAGAAAGAAAAAGGAAAAASASAAKMKACQDMIVSFDAQASTIVQKRQYAECVQLLHPRTDCGNMIGPVVGVIAVIGMILFVLCVALSAFAAEDEVGLSVGGREPKRSGSHPKSNRVTARNPDHDWM